VKRAVITIAVFLLLGAIVNVAVAWTFAFFAPQPVWRTPTAALTDSPTVVFGLATRREAQTNVQFELQRTTGVVIVGARHNSSNLIINGKRAFEFLPFDEFRHELPACSQLRQAEWARDELAELLWRSWNVSIDEYSCGWPWPALTGWCTFGSTASELEITPHGLIRLSMSPSNRTMARVLPWYPAWAGFVGNTLVFGGTLGAIVFVFGAARRWMRTSRGLCVKCAYPIGASDVCTECGAAVCSGRRPARV